MKSRNLATRWLYRLVWLCFGVSATLALVLSFEVHPTRGAAPGRSLRVPILSGDDIPDFLFFEGERMHFRFGWNGLEAAELTIHAERRQVAGRWHYRYVGTGRTLPIVRWLYPADDRVEAWLDAELRQPVAFRFDQAERGRRAQTQWRHENGRFVGTRIVEQAKYPLAATRNGDYDPFTVAFLARSVRLSPGKAIAFRVFDGKSRFVLTFIAETRERIVAANQTYDTLRIRPVVTRLDGGERPRKIYESRVWLTDDRRQVPVRLESKVFFGRVHGELVEYTPGRLSSAMN